MPEPHILVWEAMEYLLSCGVDLLVGGERWGNLLMPNPLLSGVSVVE
jgi:hypothetical protein